MALALFDFDGTITFQDSYTKFLYYISSKPRLICAFIGLWPVIILYKVGLLSGPKIRPILSKVALWRRNVAEIETLAESFAKTVIPQMIRPDMLDKIKWHQSQGDEVYLVSASLAPYMSCYARQIDVDLICTELEVSGDYYTGHYLQGDCTGQNKVKFIKSQVDLSSYDTIYAYGDTEEDRPMLELAGIKYYQGQHALDN